MAFCLPAPHHAVRTANISGHWPRPVVRGHPARQRGHHPCGGPQPGRLCRPGPFPLRLKYEARMDRAVHDQSDGAVSRLATAPWFALASASTRPQNCACVCVCGCACRWEGGHSCPSYSSGVCLISQSAVTAITARHTCAPWRRPRPATAFAHCAGRRGEKLAPVEVPPSEAPALPNGWRVEAEWIGAIRGLEEVQTTTFEHGTSEQGVVWALW